MKLFQLIEACTCARSMGLNVHILPTLTVSIKLSPIKIKAKKSLGFLWPSSSLSLWVFGLFQGFRDILLLLNVFEGYFGYLLTCTQHLDQTDLDFPICSWEKKWNNERIRKNADWRGKSTNIYNTKLRYIIFFKGFKGISIII